MTSITVSPTSLTLTFLGDTGTLRATLTDASGGNPQIAVAWSSSAPTVAEVSSSGLVTARSAGSASITASAGGLTSSPVSVTVDQQVSQVTVDPPSLSFSALGETRVLTASAADQGGALVAGTTFNWVTTDPGVASVSQNGEVTAEGNGTASVRATTGSVNSANVPVTVQQVAVSASLTSAASVALSSIGETSQITVEARDALDRIIEAPNGSYVSSDPTVAIADANGLISATGNGQAQIAISVDGVPADPVQVTVEQVAASVSAEPGLLILQSPGETGTAMAEVLDALGTAIAGAPLTWVSADAGIATVDPEGPSVTVTARRDGVTVLTASSGGMTSNPVEVFVGSGGVTELSSGDRITGLSGPAGLQRFYRITVLPGTGELHFATGGGTAFGGAGPGDLDLFARLGQMPTNDFDDPDQQSSGNPANNEWIEILDPTPGEWFFLVDGFVDPNTGTGPGYADVDLTVRMRDDEQGFDVELAFLSDFTANQQAIVRQAANRWEPALPRDLIGLWIETDAETAPVCGLQGLGMNDYADDLGVFVGISDFDGDGPGGTLAAASPCFTRVVDGLPIIGVLLFDEADLASMETSGQLLETAMHEFGHVLGVGTLWRDQLVGAGTSEPHFTGPLAIEAFDQVGGANYSGPKVPVENEGEQGSVDVHWRESVFGAELMTPFAEQNEPEPLSIVTLQSLADVGWPEVNQDEADAYQLPAGGGAAQRAAGDARAIVRTNDILWVDLYAVGEDGEVTLVRKGTRIEPIAIR